MLGRPTYPSVPPIDGNVPVSLSWESKQARTLVWYGKKNLKQDQILEMVTKLAVGGGVPQLAHSNSQLSLYEPDHKKGFAASRLGGGTFGSTYRMRKKDRVDNLRYAVKFIEDKNSEPSRRELKKDAQLLSRLHHGHIVRCLCASWGGTIVSPPETTRRR